MESSWGRLDRNGGSLADTMEQLLGGEIYHYHTKLMMKEAHTGGSFVWHQDYGSVELYGPGLVVWSIGVIGL